MKMRNNLLIKSICLILISTMAIILSMGIIRTYKYLKSDKDDYESLSNIYIAYDSYDKVWAYVGIKNSELYVQIYNKLGQGRSLLGETYLSKMVHTPRRHGTEDFNFRMQSGLALRQERIRGSIPSGTDMTDPNIGYQIECLFEHPRIIYNPSTRSFLVTWIQRSYELGEQLVCQVFRYDVLRNCFSKFDEPRVLSKIKFINNHGRIEPKTDINIIYTDVDVTSDFK